ncbi:MAG: mannose-1-phosphate guanylyltransferase [Myxococcaceae bacterium]
MALHPVIMAGGSGTRFWPLSRKALPKQFLALGTERPLIVETQARVSSLAKTEHTWVVCGEVHAKTVRKLLPKLPKGNVLVEPVARNTAPAIGLAAIHILKKDRNGILLVLPSDHHVRDVPAFATAMTEAQQLALRGWLVTVGIRPTRPDTGFGYLALGEPIDGNARTVKAFVEKPDLPTAEQYVASGRFAWNGGIFAFRADRILEEFQTHMPTLHAALMKMAGALGKRNERSVVRREFPNLPAVSIDYGVMEKAQRIAVVPGDFGWSDVGSFAALPEVQAADARGNVVTGRGAVLVDCDGCIVVAKDRPLALVGMKDIVAVDSGDAVLVLPKKDSQRVRDVVAALPLKKLGKFV